MALEINNITQTRQLGRRPSSIKTITKHNNLVRTMLIHTGMLYNS